MAHLVLMHDPTVDRTTNGTGKVAELTFAEIRRLDAGLGEHVPTLEETLALTHGKVVLQIELKGSGTALPVVQAVEAADAVDQVILTSFKHHWLVKRRHRIRSSTPVRYGVDFQPTLSSELSNLGFTRFISGTSSSTNSCERRPWAGITRSCLEYR